LIGRTKHHQSGKGLFVCTSGTDIEYSRESGAEYWLNMIRAEHEYRAHVFLGKVIYLVRKVRAEDPKEHWIGQIKEQLESEGLPVDEIEATLSAFRKVAKYVELPSSIVRSNRRGWRFSRVAHELSAFDNICSAAVSATALIGVDFGAVDIGTDHSERTFVYEVNSAPGLEGSALSAWVEAFRGALEQSERVRAARDLLGAMTREERDAMARMLAQLVERSA
jgi:hypothetical protein